MTAVTVFALSGVVLTAGWMCGALAVAAHTDAQINDTAEYAMDEDDQ